MKEQKTQEDAIAGLRWLGLGSNATAAVTRESGIYPGIFGKTPIYFPSFFGFLWASKVFFAQKPGIIPLLASEGNELN